MAGAASERRRAAGHVLPRARLRTAEAPTATVGGSGLRALVPHGGRNVLRGRRRRAARRDGAAHAAAGPSGSDPGRRGLRGFSGCFGPRCHRSTASWCGSGAPSIHASSDSGRIRHEPPRPRCVAKSSPFLQAFATVSGWRPERWAASTVDSHAFGAAGEARGDGVGGAAVAVRSRSARAASTWRRTSSRMNASRARPMSSLLVTAHRMPVVRSESATAARQGQRAPSPTDTRAPYFRGSHAPAVPCRHGI